MRTICGLAGLAAAGFLAASAYGVGIPTVSTPTVTAPSVSVPSVSLPSLPKPTLPAPTVTVTTPKPPPAPVPAPVPAPTVSTTVSTPPAPPPPAHVTTTTAAAKTAAPSPSASPSPAPSRAAPSSAPAPVSAPAGRPSSRSSSYGVAGSSHTTRRRSAHSSLPGLHRVIARFTLAHPARVRISIMELAPVCRALRSYLVRLPKGTHAFRFPVTRATEIGTYRVTATLRNHKLFSVHARRLHKRVRLGGTANVCPELNTRTAYSLAAPSTLAGAGSLTGPSGKGQLHTKSARAQREAAPAANGPQHRDRNPLVRAVSITDAPPTLQPLLYTLLAIAIVLLALAAAPQHVLPAGRAAAIVATRRAYFAAAGIWLLVVVAIVTAFA